MEQQPIFIVGAPRSGTTLLAAMLNAHSRISCGTETRFFHFLATVNEHELCAPTHWPAKAVDFLFTLDLVDLPVPAHYGLSREQLYRYLQGQPPSIAVLLAALTEQAMIMQGKQRWAEKSPEHLLYLPTIRRHFPESPLIRILRDPRDVALSLTKTPWASQDFFKELLFWREYDEQSAAFCTQDSHCYTLYYEKLVQSPAAELKRLCAFLGEDFEPQMLDTSRSAQRVVTQEDSWHRIVHKPVDQSRSQVWKQELSAEQKHTAEALVGDRLLAYGYECTATFDGVAQVYPTLVRLLSYRTALIDFAAQGIRFWGQSAPQQRRLTIYVGNPDQDHWFRAKPRERWWDLLRILTQILRQRLAQESIYWVYDPAMKPKLGRCSRVLAAVFQVVGQRQVHLFRK